MGLFRLLLAIAVVLNHTLKLAGGFNQGASAVACFMLLSGFVMTKLVQRYYANPADCFAFYLDRAARLCPQYFFYLAVTAALIFGTGLEVDFWKTCVGSPIEVFNQVTTLPLSFQNVLSIDCQYLPQAWSLGLELSFYLLAPFVVTRPKLNRALFALSLLVFLPAYLGVIDSSQWGYRALPGVFWIFALGIAAAHDDKLLCAAGWSIALVLFIGHYWHSEIFMKEVTLGVVLGLPALLWLERLTFHPIDELLGNISYGVFLNHVAIIGVMKAVGFDFHQHYMQVIVYSLIGGAASYALVERPAINLRRKLRRQRDKAQQSAPALAAPAPAGG